jgi:SAM-dependent methyltransferase
MVKPSFLGQILSGKTIGRFLFNREVARHARTLSGKVLDIAGGAGGYRAFLPPGLELTRTDLREQEGVAPIDFNKSLPFPDGSFDHVLLFNALYIAEEPEQLLREIRRVLRAGGSALVASPFLQNEMREPHDYRRLTSEGLEKLFRTSGFTAEVTPYGERFTVAAHLLHSFFLLSLIRLPFYALALGFDALVPRRVRSLHPAPLGYFCVLT